MDVEGIRQIGAFLVVALLVFVVGSFWLYVIIYYGVLHAMRNANRQQRITATPRSTARHLDSMT